MTRKRKTVLVMSDLHCGHVAGLTPHCYASSEPFTLNKQSDAYDKYLEILKKVKHVDVLIVNGDLIDGKGGRSGGTELITSDRLEQCNIAAECILQVKADKIVIVRGTPYHAGSEEDWEDVIASKVNACKIGDHEWIDVNGVVFDCKHKIGGSSIPHGRHTPIAKERLSNLMWQEYKDHPKGDIFIRSHVHYYAGAFGPNWWGCTTPALQGLGTKYGKRQCSGTVDWGLLQFDIMKDGQWSMWKHIHTIQSQIPKVVSL